MRTFNYSEVKNQKWDSDILGLIAAIYREAGKQELYLKQRPQELEKLVEIAKIQSTEDSNAIENREFCGLYRSAFGIRCHNTSVSSTQYTKVSYIGIIPLTVS